MDANLILTKCAEFEVIAKKKKPKKGWYDKPEGWTGKSVKKYWKSMTGKKPHKFTECVKKMKGHLDDPKAFCASTKYEAKK